MSDETIRGPANLLRSALMLVGLTVAGLSAPALAQDTADSADADSASVTTGTGMLPSSVTVGEIDPNGKVPVLNGVPGSGIPNMDLAIPLSILTHGNSYCFTVSLQDYNVTGNYEVDYYIKQVVEGVTKTIVHQTIVTNKSTEPGDTWVWDIYSAAIPDSPGIATLYGRVRWGTGYTTEAVISTKILIQ